MQTIWKYPLRFEQSDHLFLEIPIGAEPLSVQMQNGLPVLWALVDEQDKRVSYHIQVVGTGQPADVQERQYIGTFQQTMPGGLFVGHVFIGVEFD